MPKNNLELHNEKLRTDFNFKPIEPLNPVSSATPIQPIQKKTPKIEIQEPIKINIFQSKVNNAISKLPSMKQVGKKVQELGDIAKGREDYQKQRKIQKNLESHKRGATLTDDQGNKAGEYEMNDFDIKGDWLSDNFKNKEIDDKYYKAQQPLTRKDALAKQGYEDAKMEHVQEIIDERLTKPKNGSCEECGENKE